MKNTTRNEYKKKTRIYCSLLLFRWDLSSNGLQTIIVPGASNEYCIYFHKSQIRSALFFALHPSLPFTLTLVRCKQYGCDCCTLLLAFFLCCYHCILVVFKNNSKSWLFRTILSKACANGADKKRRIKALYMHY